jgi:predicted tellurium resistance membrane protein TerC
MNWRSFFFNIGFVAAIVVSIALWETNTLSHWGKAGIIIATIFAPSFVYRTYRLWERREQLKEITEMTTMQFKAIKQEIKNTKRRKKEIHKKEKRKEKAPSVWRTTKNELTK